MGPRAGEVQVVFPVTARAAEAYILQLRKREVEK